MTATLIKYTAVTFCSIYSFSKLINKKTNWRNLILLLIYSCITSVPIYFAHITFPLLQIAVFWAFILMFNFFYFHEIFRTTTVLSIISLSLSFISYSVSAFICLPLAYILYSIILNQEILDIVSFTLAGLLHFLCTFLFFKIKRFQNGVLSFTEKLNSDISVILGILILFITSFFYATEDNYFINIIIVAIIILFGCLLFFWWKKHITNIYLEKVHNRNIEILENSLLEQQEINSKLTKSNEELSSIIHRDNKLIPAMQSAVEEILACNSPDEQREKSKLLLPQLKAMSSQRSTILTNYENLHKVLVQTGILSIDASLKYLMKRANSDGVSFELSVACDLKEFVKDLICENDLNTLILDLCENALIAVRETKIKNVLVVFGIENESFIISVYDSGLSFEPKVIENLGKKRITTHKATGGSGIGLMTTSELLRKHNASFVIDENIDNDSYAKKVSVIFDGLSQCRVVTATDKITRPL